MSRLFPGAHASSLKHVVGVAAIAVLLAGCGHVPSGVASTPTMTPSGVSPAATTSPTGTPSAAPTPSIAPPAAGFLFAVVEGGYPPPNVSEPGTVAIVGLDGYAKAKATFQPRVGPVIADAYTPLQGVAQVVGSSVYYLDGAGTVRVLRVGSQPQVVARFPLQPAQEDVWFAVSPDGSRVLAGILTFPALGPLIPGTGWHTSVGPSKFDLETAPAGGQTKTLVHLEVPQGSNVPTPTFPVGWTVAGPAAMVPLYVTSQNIWPGGPLYVIDDSGKKTTRLGGSDCNSASITPNGLIPCVSSTGVGVVSVRDTTGKVLWVTHASGFDLTSVHISPDGEAISDGNEVSTDGVTWSMAIEMHSGRSVELPKMFFVEGWLDSNTVVGRSGGDGDLSWISLGDPIKVHDLGFKGDFVATLA
jgi:hypothetical protein